MKMHIAIPDLPIRKALLATSSNLLKEIEKQVSISYSTKKEMYTKEELTRILKDTDILITSWATPNIEPVMLENSPLKMIGHMAGSVKNKIPASFIDNGGIAINGNIGFANVISEYTLMLILMSLRNAYYFAYHTKADPIFHSTQDMLGMELYGKTVSIIGLGTISKRLCELLKPFNVNLLICDDYATESLVSSLGGRKISLEEAMESGDIITIHHTLTEKTTKLVSSEMISKMKDGAIIVNTSRGKIIDETALIKELSTNRIFAALDVLENEPVKPDHPFKTMDNVILMPHIAGKSKEARNRMGSYVLENVISYLENGSIPNPITSQMLKRMS